MAYTNSPETSTYTTKRVSFVNNPQQRGSNVNQDARLVNLLVDKFTSTEGATPKYYTKSRPGLQETYSTTSGTGRGLYVWRGATFSVVGNSVYRNTSFVQSLSTYSGQVGFTEFVNSSGTVSLVLVDGVNGYVFADTSTPGTLITSPDFPSTHVPHPIFLDGYLFLAKADTQDIYNSNLNDPSLWTAGDFLSAELYPDTIQALSKNNNFLYAIGKNSIEYFFDNGNATGSPLSRQASAVQQFGTSAPGTVVQTEKEVVLVGDTASGGHTVWTIDGFKEKEISTPAIRAALVAEGAALSSATAYCLRVSSQKLYILCLSIRTLVYSFDTQLWSEFDSATGTFLCGWGSDGPNGLPYAQGKTNGKIYQMSEYVYSDAGVSFTCSIVTPKLDFETMNRKTGARLALVGDLPDPTYVDTAVNVSWSDDDYNTFSTPRVLSFVADLPILRQLGAFRRRAFKITYSLPHLLRLEGMELDINKGNS